METTAKGVFIKQQFIPLLDHLHAETMGKWGRMNAQQMVEHVTDFFKVSGNQQHYPLVTPEEQLPKFKAFLLSDKEFRENTKAPVAIIGKNLCPFIMPLWKKPSGNSKEP
jgi:oxepin-CoA hydrolase/3-oxo-5,6-dehydrosuberyl-CoA semialdehyde dehydrogenase